MTLRLEVMALYVRTRWLLFRRGLAGALTALRRTPAATGAELLPADQVARQLRDATQRGLRFLPTDQPQIIRALVLIGLLQRRGIRGSFVVGVDPAMAFSTRAWVEHDGVPLFDDGGLHRLMER